MVEHKTCSFFGHRNASLTDEELNKLIKVIEFLICCENVDIFLFGSRSNFNSLCHEIVTKFKEKYPTIIRKCYTCQSETCVLESDRIMLEVLYSKIKKDKVQLLGFEEEVEHKNKWTACKASYIERNQAMINDSDYCIFYFNESYKPQLRKQTKTSIVCYQPKSGTAKAFTYAKQRKKNVINIAQL